MSSVSFSTSQVIRLYRTGTRMSRRSLMVTLRHATGSGVTTYPPAPVDLLTRSKCHPHQYIFINSASPAITYSSLSTDWNCIIILSHMAKGTRSAHVICAQTSQPRRGHRAVVELSNLTDVSLYTSVQAMSSTYTVFSASGPSPSVMTVPNSGHARILVTLESYPRRSSQPHFAVPHEIASRPIHNMMRS